ncbi:MAG: TonB-dependent receptor [Bacteroidetes bacterium]|nr:TonB-dependent receptor [Bacteroidota bacterium]
MKKIFFLLAFFAFVGSQSLYAQNRVISGKVTSSEDNLGIPGANIIVKGMPTIGTTTDVQGQFSLSVPQNATTLIFSFIGMTAQEIEIGNQSVINVVLNPSMASLDEVVVVGYGTQIKRDLTGSIVKVNTEELKNIPVPSFEEAIQGKTSGVFIEKSSGKLGESIKMRIRGSSSVSADNQPLYVVDGMPITATSQGVGNNQPTSPLADINFADIESIQILKDASAAAIYGSRASNGVVLITTKTGKSGKTNFSLDYSVGFSEPSRLREWLNAEEYLDLFTEAIHRSPDYDPNTGLLWDWLDVPGLFNRYVKGWDGGHDTDWQSLAFQNAGSQRLNFSTSGGNEKTTFYAGFTYDDQTGILLKNDYNKISGRVSIDHQASDKLKFGITTNTVRSETNRVANDNAFATPLQLVALSPMQPAYDENGELFTRTIYYNGLISARDSHENTVVFRNFSNAYAAYQITPELSFRSEFGLDVLEQRENNFYGRLTIGSGPAGEGEARTVRVANYNTNNYFSYAKTINEKHEISATAGMSFQKSNTDVQYIYAIGFPSDDFQTLASATEVTSFSTTKTAYSYLSYFLRANYKLSDKYLVALSGRVDGSSRFGKNARYGFFPAASMGWIISNEDFLMDQSTISFLKLRTSIGVTGNSGIGDFDHLGLYQGVNYAGTPGIRPTQLESPDLAWETTTQMDIGIDFGLFDNRVTGEIDYYIKKTSNLLLNRTLPGTSGFTSVTENIGELNNRGFEVALHSNNLTGVIKWSTDFNIGFNNNEIVNINGPDIIVGVNRVREGEPMGVFVMTKYAGVDPDNGDALYYIDETSDATTNNYGSAQKQVVGSPNPDFTGGMTNTLSYKNFDLSFTFNFVYGNMIYNGGGQYQSANGDWWDNQTKDQLNFWRNPGDITDVPEARFASSNGTRESSRYLSDGSYLRLRNVTFGYNLPKSITSKLKLDRVRLYVTGVNLLTITNYTGWDPEVNYTGTGRTTQTFNIAQGNDFYTVPQARTITFGVNVGF